MAISIAVATATALFSVKSFSESSHFCTLIFAKPQTKQSLNAWSKNPQNHTSAPAFAVQSQSHWWFHLGADLIYGTGIALL